MGVPVVVKLFRSEARTLDVCRREFRLAYTVRADRTAAPLGYGVSATGAYLVTTYLPAYRSGSVLAGRRMPAPRLQAFGSALASTLAAINARSVVHCDIKPSNLLVDGDDVRVTNLGIARYIGQMGGHGGVAQCHPGWAEPEQLRSIEATSAVDVFAWACLGVPGQRDAPVRE